MDTSRWPLAAPESLVLLTPGPWPPPDAVTFRAGLVDALLRGCLRIEKRQVRRRWRTREQLLFELGPHADRAPRTLVPLVEAVRRARTDHDVDGRPGHPVRAVAAALRADLRGSSYAPSYLLPALSAQGLVRGVKDGAWPPSGRRWPRGGRFWLTAEGARQAEAARGLVASARTAVRAARQAREPAGVREARLAAASALGAAGALVAAEDDLLWAATSIRRALARDQQAEGSGPAAAPADSSDEPAPPIGGEDDEWLGDWPWDLGNLDIDRVLDAVGTGGLDVSDVGGGGDGGGGGGDGGGGNGGG